MTYTERLKLVLDSIPENNLLGIIQALHAARDQSVYVLGNGGSESLAQHLILHLRDVGIRAFDLMADNAWLTAQANDHGYQNAPGALLEVVWRPGDVLFVISGSARSENVKAALRIIHGVSNGVVIGIFGNEGGKVKHLCDEAVALSQTDYAPLEDAFSAIVHMIFEGLKILEGSVS